MRATVVLFGALVSGCAGAPTTFDLVAAPVESLGSRAARGQLVVSEPVAPAALDSERILVRPQPTQIAYLTGAQWSERLPALLQARLIQSFERSGLVKSVGRPGEHIDAQVTLESDIRAFEIDVSRGSAVVELSVKLVTDRSGKVVAAKVFTALVPVKDTKGPESSAAINSALADVLRQVVAWSAGRI